jgi:hypothetical protein
MVFLRFDGRARATKEVEDKERRSSVTQYSTLCESPVQCGSDGVERSGQADL